MKFSEIYGHEKVKQILKRAVETNNVGHAYIFEGPCGVGRYSAAKVFAEALLCAEGDGVEPCGVCSSCRMCEAKSHPDVRVITNQLYDSSVKSENLLTDTIRSMKREIYQKPCLGDRKIYIIPNADSMNISAQNSLLKILEEPPLYCTIILIAQNSNAFLETVLSRAVRVRFSPLENTLIADWLVKNGVCGAERALSAASLSGGSIGNAVSIAADEEIYRLRDETVSYLMGITSPSYKKLFGFVKYLRGSKGNYREVFSVLISFFSDLMKLSELGDFNSVVMKDKEKELKEFERILSKGAAAELLNIAVKAFFDIEQNVNYAALVQLMAIDFWEVIHDRSNRSKI